MGEARSTAKPGPPREPWSGGPAPCPGARTRVCPAVQGRHLGAEWALPAADCTCAPPGAQSTPAPLHPPLSSKSSLLGLPRSQLLGPHPHPWSHRPPRPVPPAPLTSVGSWSPLSTMLGSSAPPPTPTDPKSPQHPRPVSLRLLSPQVAVFLWMFVLKGLSVSAGLCGYKNAHPLGCLMLLGPWPGRSPRGPLGGGRWREGPGTRRGCPRGASPAPTLPAAAPAVHWARSGDSGPGDSEVWDPRPHPSLHSGPRAHCLPRGPTEWTARAVDTGSRRGPGPPPGVCPLTGPHELDPGRRTGSAAAPVCPHRLPSPPCHPGDPASPRVF